ncbi:hypothetical protein HG536_0C06030 [Torulaspora globosa]|uniref:Piwi domain-containing protein n=1 Tax=Torulaspora globosa TaxID=48254 RepID=A0A7G3ZFZ8_9SACH|nr:uncharacterized protein HG536_0C06030 [Torulaspora globosa]QLL32434.1 hypothetical protein HG536_0C06030 [Torulaspora globosa]
MAKTRRNDAGEVYEVEKRLDYGTKGTQVEVLSNQIHLSHGDDVPDKKDEESDGAWWKTATIYIYHIEFVGKASGRAPPSGNAPPPAPLSKPKRYELLEELYEEDETLRKYKDRIAFDGQDTLYSRVPLEEFTLFDGCWKVGKKKKAAPGAPAKKEEASPAEGLVTQITLQFASKVSLKDIYKATMSEDTEEQESKMSAPEKTALLYLMGAKFLASKDPIFQMQGNKFFIFNNKTKAIPFQVGGYLMFGFTVSLVFSKGTVLLNVINVSLPFYKHTKYLPGDPKFKENDKTRYTLMDWLIECYAKVNSKSSGAKSKQAPTGKDLNNFLSQNMEVKNLMKGLKVYRYYINYSVDANGTPKPPRKMQAKGIFDLARETADSLKFKALPSSLTKDEKPVPGEQEITVTTTSYFAKKYGIKLQYPDVRMVSLGGKNIVPLECLTIVPGQKLKGQIYEEKTMIDFTALRPDDKFNLISNLALPSVARALNSEGNGKSKKSATRYEFLKVPSRIIDAPTVKYKDTNVVYKDAPFGTQAAQGKGPNEETKGKWNLMKHQFISASADPYKLRAIFINDSSRAPPQSILGKLTKSVEQFAKDAGSVGVNFDVSGHPLLINDFNAPVKRRVDSPDGSRGRGRGNGRGRGRGRGGAGRNGSSFVYEITPGEKKLVELLKSIPPKVYVLFVLARGNDAGIYNRLKEIADLRFGVLNSCVVWDSFSKNSPQYNTNAVMKMNLKLQGTNHSLDAKDMELLTDKATGLPFLVIAADVTHYPEKDQNSIAAMVGSYEKTFSKFPGDYMLQDEPGEEIISRIGELVASRLDLYREKNNGKLPPRVLFYRDGVSETQLSQVVKIEVKGLKQALRKYNGSGKKYDPPVTCVVVAKRNMVRFKPLHKNAKNAAGEEVAVQSMGNVMPGTVVDREITSPAHFDFFLQSQQVLAGTGVPCHYWCVYNENHFDSDYLQAVSHALCYIFGRSSTSVKVVAPVYYADLLCTRASQFFKANFAMVNAEFQKQKKNKEDVITAYKLLPPIGKNVKSLMYYI